MPLIDLLSQNPIFSHLDPARKNTLSELAIARRYPKGGWITHHGDIWPYFFIVESGKINATTPLPVDRIRPTVAPSVAGRPPRRVVRCEVMAAEPEDTFSDLLPWADPYIASLVALSMG